MSNGTDASVPYTEHELIAARLSALLCCPSRIPQLVEPSVPASAIGWRFEGEIAQTGLVWDGTTFPGAVYQVTNVVSVPRSMSGVINRIGIVEHYPAAFYGAFASLLINGAVDAHFPKAGVNIGWSLSDPMSVWIPLQENDVIGFEIECHWNTRMFLPAIPDPPTDHQLTWSFVLQGYWLEQNWWRADKSNEEAY